MLRDVTVSLRFGEPAPTVALLLLHNRDCAIIATQR